MKYSISRVLLGVLFASSMLFARVIIDDLQISKDIDKKRYIPIDITNEIANNSKSVAVSARVRNISNDKKIRVVWYKYNQKNQKVIKSQSSKKLKNGDFLYHIVNFSQMPDVGKYFVDIVVDNRLMKTKSFEIYESRSRYTLKWIKLNANGVKLFNKKKYDEAIVVFKDAIKVLEQDDLISYKNILHTLNNMAQTYASNKNYRASKIIIKQAEKIAKNHDLLDSLGFAKTLDVRAYVSNKEFDYKKAKELYIKSLEISDKNSKSSCNRYIIDRKESLYDIYMRQKDYDNARFIVQEIVECYKKDTQGVVWSLLMISDTYLAQKRYKIAQRYLDRVYKILKKKKKPNKYLVYKMMKKISQLYIETKRYKKATIVTNKLIKKSKKLYGAKSRATIDALKKLAQIYRDTGDIKRAKVVEKNIDKLYTKIIKAKKCSQITKDEDKHLFGKVYKRYSELDIDRLSDYNIKRYIDKSHHISLIAPLAWELIESDRYILNLGYQSSVGVKSRYTLRVIPRFWNQRESRDPKKLITQLSKDINDIFIKSAKKIGDNIKYVISLKIFKHGSYTIGHTLLHQRGSLNSWRGNTFIYNGTDIYTITTLMNDKDLLLGEFLSSLSVESFCSKRFTKPKKEIDGVDRKLQELNRNLKTVEER